MRTISTRIKRTHTEGKGADLAGPILIDGKEYPFKKDQGKRKDRKKK